MKGYKFATLFLIVGLFVFILSADLSKPCFSQVKEAPSQGGVYRRPLEFMPGTLDPCFTTDIYSVAVTQQLFEGLVQFDQSLNVIPALAKSWKISHDGLTYTFLLREGVKFHNGREVTADDFVYSFNRVVDPKHKALASQFMEKVRGFREFQEGKANAVRGFKSIGKYTFEIRLVEPFAPLLSSLGAIHLKVVPKEEVKKTGSVFSKHPVGTGPFKFVSMKEKEEVVLEANQKHFEGRPPLDKIIFKIFHGAPRDKILKEFKEGALEESYIPPGEIESIVNEKRYLFLQKPILSLRFYGLHLTSAPLDNKKLRKAINFAINKKFIISQIHKDQFNLAKGVLPPGLPGYDPARNPYPHDETKALKLLSEAGFPRGKGLPALEIWSASSSEAARRELNEIRSQLSKVGIQTTLHFETNWPNFEAMLRTNKAPVFIYVWYADFPDPDNFLGSLFYSKSKNNFTAYRNPEVDRLLEKARRETDYLKRIELYRRIEGIVLEDAPIVPMVNNFFQSAYQPYVRGIELNALGGPYIPMKKIWLKRGG